MSLKLNLSFFFTIKKFIFKLIFRKTINFKANKNKNNKD